MALLIANPDGSSNAVAGDDVVTGGGIYKKLADGTSQFIKLLPTSTGTTGSYSELVNIFNSLNEDIGTPKTKKDSFVNGVVVEDTEWNYDDFTVGEDYNLSSGGSSSLNMSNIIGYGILALVGIVILDKMMGK